jgi:hypothetical protein
MEWPLVGQSGHQILSARCPLVTQSGHLVHTSVALWVIDAERRVLVAQTIDFGNHQTEGFCSQRTRGSRQFVCTTAARRRPGRLITCHLDDRCQRACSRAYDGLREAAEATHESGAGQSRNKEPAHRVADDPGPQRCLLDGDVR